MCIDADIDCHKKVGYEDEHCYSHIHQRGQSESDEHKHLIDAVEAVVEIITINRPLSLAHPCESAVGSGVVGVVGHSR